MSAGPYFVARLMPTADRRPFVAQAIRWFLAQDYTNRELVIVDDGADAVGVPNTERIRYFGWRASGLSVRSATLLVNRYMETSSFTGMTTTGARCGGDDSGRLR